MGFSKNVASLMIFVLVAAACGGDDETDQTGQASAPTTAATATTIPEDQPTAAVDESEPEPAGDDEDPVPAEQASPEAVVAAYFEAADAHDPGAMFALISPDIREGFTLARFTACVSEQIDSGVDVAFEHSDTYVEGGSTFVEAVITLSEQGEGAVSSDDSEVVAIPAVVEAVEIDGLWWAAGDKGGDAIFSCAREGSDESGPICAQDECEDDRGPVVDVEWRIALNDQGVGIHTVFMIKTFSPLQEADIEDVGGRLVWEQTEVELCAIGIRSVGEGFVQIGDIFQTTEGCGPNTEMQQTFDDLGPPDSACVYVRVDGVDDEYCAPLTVRTAEPQDDEPTPPGSTDLPDELREVIDEAVPEGPAPAGLADVVLPTDVEGVSALFDALPNELIGGVKAMSARTPGDLAADYMVPDQASRYGFQAMDLSTSFMGSILPAPRADVLVAFFVLSDDDDYTVEMAGHDGDLYWVTLISFNSGFGIDGVEEVYTVHWGEADSPWTFMVGAPTEAGRDELIAAFIVAA